jgi:RimJ/RimL family protein N-acetyltransferase
MSHMPWPCTEAAAQGWILLGFHSGARLFAILRREDQTFLGAIGFGESLARPAVGYWIGRAYWDAGYATEALRRIVDYVKSLGAADVRAETFPGNRRSERVLEKCGFVPEGQARRNFPARGGVRTVNLWILDLG